MTEIIKGTKLSDLLKTKYDNLDESEIKLIVSQILKAVNHCHTSKIIHCDLRP